MGHENTSTFRPPQVSVTRAFLVFKELQETCTCIRRAAARESKKEFRKTCVRGDATTLYGSCSLLSTPTFRADWGG